MSDINFLSNKKFDHDREPKPKAEKREKVAWSEPENKQPIPKGSAFTLLSFFNKKKNNQPGQTAPKTTGSAMDQGRIKQSRLEILKLIKDHEGRQAQVEKPKPVPTPSPTAKSPLKTGGGKSPGWLNKILARFKKAPSRKEVFIDYQQALDQEKNKRPLFKASPSPYTMPQSQKPAAEPLRPTPSLQPAYTRPTAPKPVSAKMAAAATVPAAPTSVQSAASAQEPPLKQSEPIQLEKFTPKVIETNLIKGEIVTYFDWRKSAFTMIEAIIIPVFLVALIYAGLIFYQKLSQARYQEQNAKLNLLTQQIKLEESNIKAILDFQSKLKLVAEIFAQHIYWTNFFQFLEDNTLSNVYYTGFNGNTNGHYPLGVMATKFSDISEQVETYRKNEKVIQVFTTGGEYFAPSQANKQSGVKFNLDLKIDPNIFIE